MSNAKRHSTVADVHALLMRDGYVLLGRRISTEFGDGKLNLPAGHLDAGESLAEAVCRECKEELAIAVSPAGARFAHLMHKARGDAEQGGERLCTFFIISSWLGEPYIAEPDKFSELVWAPVDDLPDDMIAFVRWAVHLIQQGVTFSTYGW